MDKARYLHMRIPKCASASVKHALIRTGLSTGKTEIANSNYPHISHAQVFGNKEFIYKETILTAHFLFGIHKHIFYPCTYFTFLRNPAERIISTYFYIKYLYDKEIEVRLSDNFPSLEDVLEMKDPFYGITARGGFVFYDNLQCRYIAGEWPAYGKVNDKTLEKAKENIKNHFCFVGTVDCFSDDIIKLSSILKIKKLPFIFVNKTSNKKEVPRHILERITEREKYDWDLFSYIKERKDNAQMP